MLWENRRLTAQDSEVIISAVEYLVNFSTNNFAYNKPGKPAKIIIKIIVGNYRPVFSNNFM